MSDPAGKPARQSWHSVPLMWFVVGLPAVVVIAAFVTLAIAVKSSDDVVRDDFRKEGLAIYADPARDAAAAGIGAAAVLTVHPTGELRATLSLAHGQPPRSLVVVLSHATRAEYDRMLTLEAGEAAYEGRGDPLPPGHWYVEVTPPGREWRLKGDFRDSVELLRLKPPGIS